VPIPTDPPYRIGFGYDIHRLEPQAPEGPGRPFLLAGVPIPHDRGPVAHSDGDALYHAVTDALLGALALPDIGQLFPDNHPDNDARDSASFLRDAHRRITDAGWRVANLDAAVILQRPKIGDLKLVMRHNLAGLLDTPLDRINVKGRTKEQVDATGQGLAVEVHALLLLVRAPAPGAAH